MYKVVCPVCPEQAMPDDSHADVLAVVTKCDEPITYTNKTGKEVTKQLDVYLERVAHLHMSTAIDSYLYLYGEREREGAATYTNKKDTEVTEQLDVYI